MNQRIYHGNLQPIDLSNALLGYFNRGNYRVQRIGDSDKLIVQVKTQDRPMSGGQTAMSVVRWGTQSHAMRLMYIQSSWGAACL